MESKVKNSTSQQASLLPEHSRVSASMGGKGQKKSLGMWNTEKETRKETETLKLNFKYSQPGCYFLFPCLSIRRLTFQHLPSTTHVVAVLNVKLNHVVVSECTDPDWEPGPLGSFVLLCLFFLKHLKRRKKDTRPAMHQKTHPWTYQVNDKKKKKEKSSSDLYRVILWCSTHAYCCIACKPPKPPKVFFCFVLFFTFFQ